MITNVRDSTIGMPRVPKGAGSKGSGALGLYRNSVPENESFNH